MSSYADKHGKSKGAVKPAQAPFRFINYDLTAKDRAWLAETDLSVETPVQAMFEEVEQSYKFSLSYDAKHSCYVASLTDRGEASAFSNACLTGRGQTPADSIASLWYRHIVLAQRDWSFFAGVSAGVSDKYF